MKKILSISTLFVISVALSMATLGNGLVTSEASAVKEGPACISFDHRNNPVKDVGPRSVIFPYAEECQSKGKDFDRHCVYGTISEDGALDIRENFLAQCAKQNQ